MPLISDDRSQEGHLLPINCTARLGVTYKTAWFMAHRIREAMRDDGLADPLGGDGKIVEADETYHRHGQKAQPQARRRPSASGGQLAKKHVDLLRWSSAAAAFAPCTSTARTAQDARPIVRANVARESRLHHRREPAATRRSATSSSHETVNHAGKEYARGDVHTNTIEGFFSIFKRGMKGVYQHCGEKHLHRYLAEFDFRYNNRIAVGINESDRAENALKGIVCKRLTYRRPDEAKVS